MKHYFLTTLILVFISTVVSSQTSSTKYFKDRYSDNEVPLTKAKFSRTTTQNTDGSVSTDLRDLKKDIIIESETFKGEEPVGKWIVEGKILDFDFTLKPSTRNCTDTVPGLKAGYYLENNDSLNYKAPVLVSGHSFYKYCGENIVFPRKAAEEGISGTVYLSVRISVTGKMEEVALVRGANILLDKEAVRIVRNATFSSPAIINGEPRPICFMLPLKFTMR